MILVSCHATLILCSTELDEEGLNQIRADPSAETIEEDGIASISNIQIETDAPWELARVSQREKLSGDPALLNYEYRYDDKVGRDVGVYVVDTGINTEHRKSVSALFRLQTRLTHLNNISDLDWALTQSKMSRRPSVVSLSIVGPVTSSVDNAVATLTRNDVHVVVASGNDSKDTNGFGPAPAEPAITVAASDINDDLARFSNYGNGRKPFIPFSYMQVVTL